MEPSSHRDTWPTSASAATSFTLTTDTRTRAMLIGGIPSPERLLMWWNYVARTRDEIAAAHADWAAASERFGHVGSPLPRIDTAPPPWTGN